MIFENSRSKYKELIYSIKKNKYKTYTISDYILAKKENKLESHFVIMRHDVDANIENALKMAKIESYNDISSTYYFRIKKGVFVPNIVDKISKLGHEIGYHYEHLPDCDGNLEKANKLFIENLSKLREVSSVKSVCMHGRPFSKYDSRDFWKIYNLSDFQLASEPYLNIDYSDIFYFSDTGLSWNNAKFNIRDIVSSQKTTTINSTDELIDLFNRKEIDKVSILTHTDNWVNEPLTWIYYNSLNGAVNVLKRVLKILKA